jgi:hypothetical protein
MKKTTDDWGSPLGADPDQKEAPAPKKGSATALVYFFRDSLPVEPMNRIGAPVNAKALLATFKKLTSRGFTDEQIRAMILTFAKEIARKPLPVHVAPWRGFIANIDKYAKDVDVKQVDEPTESSVDPRLTGF